MAEDPAHHPAARLLRRPLAQPDRRSCGAATMVVAALLVSGGGEPPGADAFRARALETHRRLTGPLDARGRAQLPWPRALGTPPWAVARELTALTGVTHRTAWVRTGRGAAPPVDQARPWAPVALYVGNRWLPRHVVLVLGPWAGGLRVYEPASGRLVTVSRAALTDHRLALAGWDVPWFSVRPAARRTPA